MASVVNLIIKLQAKDQNVVSVAQNVQKDLDSIIAKADTVKRKLQDAFSFSNFKSSLMSIPGMQFLMNPYTLIASGIGAVTSLGAQAEMTSTAFRVLVGDEERAAKLLGDIDDFAAHTPFTKLGLTDATKTLLNFGVASDNALGILKQLGDISMGDAQKLGSLSTVYGQVSAASKLSGQDLLQFINAGFNPLKELQKMGEEGLIPKKSYQELQDMMSKGQIGIEAVNAAMRHATGEGGQFHGMMEQTSETLAGKWSTAVGLVQQKATGIYDKIQPYLMKGVELFSTAADIVMGIVGGVVDVIDFLVSHLESLAYIGVVVGIATVAFNAQSIALAVLKGAYLVQTAVTSGLAGAQGLLNAIMAANPIGIVVTAVAALAAGVVYCWNKFAGFRAVIKSVWDVIKGFGNAIKNYLIDRITGLLKGIGKLGEALSKLFSGDFKGAWTSAKDAALKISGYEAVKNFAGNVKGIKGNYAQHLAEERQKQDKKETASQGISTPHLAGSKTGDYGEVFQAGTGSGGKGKKGGSGRKTAEAAVTGGTRSTSIHMTISKFFDNINVYMADKTDTSQLEQIILQSLNRSLAIATSTDR